jgi:peptidoglycan/xylan/chitin deacetylase (PgdA/CDA1 family)
MTQPTSQPQRVLVLMYHRVDVALNRWEAKYCVSPRQFEKHIAALAAAGYKACSLNAFMAWMNGQTELADNAFLLTFDDGYQGLSEHVAPVLAKLDWPVTVFLVSGLIGQSDIWCQSQNPAEKTYPLLTASQIRKLSHRGFTFQSHTRSHADLTALADDALAAELSSSKQSLEALLERPVDYLAYPYGRHNDHVVEMTRAAGYAAAFSVRPGFNRRGQDPFRIRRLDVFGTDSAAMLLRKIRLGSNDGTALNTVRYYLERFRRGRKNASVQA